jgi:hypothetical protein
MTLAKTKLLVTQMACSRLEALLGEEWRTVRPGAILQGRYSVILLSAAVPKECSQEEFDKWVNENLRCRLDVGGVLTLL